MRHLLASSSFLFMPRPKRTYAKGPIKPKPPRLLEHKSQAAFITWCKVNERRYPELKTIHAIPNAARRSYKLVGFMLAEGLRKGVLDIHLPIPRGPWSALWMEFKVEGGRLTADQDAFADLVRKERALVAVVYQWHQAAELVEEYLRLPRPRAVHTPIVIGNHARLIKSMSKSIQAYLEKGQDLTPDGQIPAPPEALAERRIPEDYPRDQWLIHPASKKARLLSSGTSEYESDQENPLPPLKDN